MQYYNLVKPIVDKAQWAHIKIGSAYGVAQSAQFLVFAAMFYFGGKVVSNNIDELDEDGNPKINPEDIFIAMFAIMFGASQAGSAASYGPDNGKATVAADTIFTIIETPSKINAVEIDKDDKKRRI